MTVVSGAHDLKTDIFLEACVDSVESAVRAAHQGAHRLELCANLHLDGTTPEEDQIRAVLRAVEIPVKVMIRPRGGDFRYSATEFSHMVYTIERCKTLGVPEIATGVLHDDNSLDVDRISQLAAAAHPMTVTIHKCIDLVPDIFAAIRQLKSVPNITHILSSGQAATAWEGRDRLKQLLSACGNDLVLIAAGNVTQENLLDLISATGIHTYHGRKIV